MENPVDFFEPDAPEPIEHGNRGRPTTPGAPLEAHLVRVTAAQWEAARAIDPSGRKEASGGIRFLLEQIRTGALPVPSGDEPEKIL